MLTGSGRLSDFFFIVMYKRSLLLQYGIVIEKTHLKEASGMIVGTHASWVDIFLLKSHLCSDSVLASKPLHKGGGADFMIDQLIGISDGLLR